MLEHQLTVIEENLREIDKRQTELYEKRLAHVKEKATVFVQEWQENLFTGEPLQSYSALYEKESNPASDGAAEGNLVALRALFDTLHRLDRITVCRQIAFSLLERNCFPSIHAIFDASSRKLDGKIAYVKNYYADNAYHQFSKILENPTVLYCTDFSGVCEAVYDGITDFCILPVENSVDGRLVSFANLISKYDLKIVLSCDVSSADASKSTCFALLCKTIQSLHPSGGGVPFFEFCLALSNRISICDILTAAENFALPLYKIDSMPLSYKEREYSYDIMVQIPKTAEKDADFLGFLCYLFLEAPQFIPIGIYMHIPE